VVRVTIGPRMTAGEVSSSKNPIDISRKPAVSIGRIRSSAVAMGFSRLPNMSATLGP